MEFFRQILDRLLKKRATPVVVIVVLAIFFLVTFAKVILNVDPGLSPRALSGDLMGQIPRPVERSLLDPLAKLFEKKIDYKLMTIQRIPAIDHKTPMPHPYVGACIHCHLYIDGPGPGAQFKTPVGAVLEQLSRLHKLGPPLWPNSRMPHPPAGRCIKCHDIVVKVPVEKKAGGFIWTF